jgi:YD repeat-containing protein
VCIRSEPYDPLGRLISVSDALGGVTRYAYDQRGLQIAQTDALNRVTTYE